MTERQHAVCPLSGSDVKLQLNYPQCPVTIVNYNIVCLMEGLWVFRTITFIDVYASSFLTSIFIDDSMTQAEKFPDPFLLKSDVNLFNHLVRKADVAGCCSAGSVLR